MQNSVKHDEFVIWKHNILFFSWFNSLIIMYPFPSLHYITMHCYLSIHPSTLCPTSTSTTKWCCVVLKIHKKEQSILSPLVENIQLRESPTTDTENHNYVGSMVYLFVHKWLTGLWLTLCSIDCGIDWD